MENLQALNLSSVSITGRLSLEGENGAKLSGVLSSHQDNWPRRRIDKLGLYEVDGTRHHMGLDIEVIRGGDAEVAMFNLEAHAFSRNERMRTSTRERQFRQFSEIQAILSDIEKLDIRARVHSHMAWSFPPDSRKPIISLPMMTLQGSGVPFTEIVGVRLNRATEEGITSVTIDLRTDRSMLAILVLPPVRSNIFDGMIDYAVQKGCQVIEEFIFATEDSISDEGAT